MKIAIIGAGITGMVAGYKLQQKGHQVTIYEKNSHVGGLCSGFKKQSWQWHLDYYYHHLFFNDREISDFAREVNYQKIFFQNPITSSLFSTKSGLRIIPLDTPLDLIRFNPLSFINRFRSGILIVLLKLMPYGKILVDYTSERFIKTISGNQSWKVLWQELFRKKFGKYAGNISASFIWARVKKRTKKLGYIKGGFQNFADYLEEINIRNKVVIKKNINISNIVKKGEIFNITTVNNEKNIEEKFDRVISTIPTQIMLKITKDLLPTDYIARLKKINYLTALVLILETDKPVLNSTYWLNICTDKVPMMVFIQHTKFVNRKYYGGKHIAYIGYYLEDDDPLFKKSKDQLIKYLHKYLLEIADNKDFKISDSFRFVGRYAQAIFDKEFLTNKPNYQTPIKNFYIANLDMTYPYDRGVNFAVKMGMEVVEII